MKGAKRFAASDSVPETNDVVFRNKRVMVGSNSDLFKSESSQQQSIVAAPLDMRWAQLSRQHVRAVNSQFASWVQLQLKNHPDELWEDGVRDYLTHASHIMAKFSDVVSWLKVNTVKGGPAADSFTSENKLSMGKSNIEIESSQEKAGMTVAKTTSSSSSWSPAVFFSNQSFGGVFSSGQNSGLLSNGQSSGLFSGTQISTKLTSGQSSGFFSNNQKSPLFSNSQSSGLFSQNQSSGIFSNNQSSGVFSSNQTTGFFSDSQISGVLSSSQAPGFLSKSRTPMLFGENSAPSDRNTPDDGDDDNEIQQPSSPSVKKSKEKGVAVVHEVKCKLYVKSSDPADKDTWKDKGTGQLSIKCREGVNKGTTESKPTIVVRNDVGKPLLNALLYPGIKTSAQKNSLVAIFHTADDDGDSSNVVPRTFLIKTKTEDDRNRLATTIQEYAPAS